MGPLGSLALAALGRAWHRSLACPPALALGWVFGLGHRLGRPIQFGLTLDPHFGLSHFPGPEGRGCLLSTLGPLHSAAWKLWDLPLVALGPHCGAAGSRALRLARLPCRPQCEWAWVDLDSGDG